jgi:hypothetical protein
VRSGLVLLCPGHCIVLMVMVEDKCNEAMYRNTYDHNSHACSALISVSKLRYTYNSLEQVHINFFFRIIHVVLGSNIDV